MNDEDYEKGLVFFDVFKNAKLEALKPKVRGCRERCRDPMH